MRVALTTALSCRALDVRLLAISFTSRVMLGSMLPNDTRSQSPISPQGEMVALSVVHQFSKPEQAPQQEGCRRYRSEQDKQSGAPHEFGSKSAAVTSANWSAQVSCKYFSNLARSAGHNSLVMKSINLSCTSLTPLM